MSDEKQTAATERMLWSTSDEYGGEETLLSSPLSSWRTRYKHLFLQAETGILKTPHFPIPHLLSPPHSPASKETDASQWTDVPLCLSYQLFQDVGQGWGAKLLRDEESPSLDDSTHHTALVCRRTRRVRKEWRGACILPSFCNSISMDSILRSLFLSTDKIHVACRKWTICKVCYGEDLNEHARKQF